MPAGVVGHQGQGHPVVADVDVRMVVGLLGEPADPPDEVQRRRRKLAQTTVLTSFPPISCQSGPSACGQRPRSPRPRSRTAAGPLRPTLPTGPVGVKITGMVS